MAVLAGRVFTWSNALTTARLVAAPFFFCAVSQQAALPAALIFWGAVATDVADGRVARARGETSNLGGLLDHATDASFVAMGLYALSMHGIVPVALPILVVLAFVQYMLDSKSLAGRALRASWLGRWNGIFYFVPLGVVATRDVFGLEWPGDGVVRWLGLALVATTIVSMADRAWTLLRDPSPDA